MRERERTRARPTPLPETIPPPLLLQLALVALPSLPPLFAPSPTAPQELALARDALETAVLLDVAAGDDAALDRHAAQLRPFYTDAAPLLAPSPREGLLRGLLLLRSLVAGRLAEFHADLAVMPPSVAASPPVAHAAALEAWLAEGAHNKVLAEGRTPPDAAAAPLLGRLLATVRGEVAASAEAAYATLTVADAVALLRLDGEADLAAVAAERGWRVADGRVHFPRAGGAAGAGGPCLLPGPELVAQALTVARELERIV